MADFKAMWEQGRSGFLEAVSRVGASGWLVLGEEVAAFEKDLAAFWGRPFAVGVANGLDALEIAFRCEGMEQGDLVLTTPLTAFATTLAIVRAGGVPVFADVDASGLLDLNHAEKVLRTLHRRLKFVVPVHLFGHAMRLSELEAFAARHGVTVIEDCAQAIGARSDGRPVGSLGRFAATSFYPTKNLGALGDAGALLCADEKGLTLARCLRDYGQSAKYVHDEIGLNSRLDELQAALLRTVQLPALKDQTDRRRAIARRFLDEIRAPGVELPVVPEGSASVWHLFPVLVEGDREAFRTSLAREGVSTGLHYPILVPEQRALRSVARPEGLPLPRAKRFATQEVSLPIHPFMSDDDVSAVVRACNAWVGP